MSVTAPSQEFNNPTCNTFAFGRVFYAVDSRIYFSVVIDTASDAGRCYQINDPTSEDIPDVLDTDGGVITLDDALNIRRLYPYRSGVLVFADNGLWYIYNPDGGFKATSFNVTKVTDRGIDSAKSVVGAEGLIFYFSNNGIVNVRAEEFDNLVAQDITETTIRSHYIDNFKGKGSVGVYDEVRKQVVWWNSDVESKGLVYDISVNAFYPQQNNSSEYKIGQPVNINGLVLYPSWRFTTRTEYGLADTTNSLFLDFGVDMSAYMVSGWETLGKFSHGKSITQAKFYFNKTETQILGYTGSEYRFDLPSSCLFQSRWDFDSSDVYSKWVGVTTNNFGKGKTVELYKPMKRGFIPDAYPYTFNTGEDIITSKQNIRGSGDAVQFLFEAQPRKDLQLLGYSVSYKMKGRM